MKLPVLSGINFRVGDDALVVVSAAAHKRRSRVFVNVFEEYIIRLFIEF
jgi:hypothetical protein